MTDFPVTTSDTGLSVSDVVAPITNRQINDDAFAPITSNTPVLDNCNRADESILSNGGRWTRTGSLVSSLGLFNHAIYGLGSNSQMSFVNAGNFADSEAWVQLSTVGINTGNYSGIVVRQDPSSNTGANCYALLFIRGSGLQLYRYNGSGVGTVLATYSTTPVSGDWLGLRAVGSRLESWYKPSAGTWQRLGTFTDTTLTHGYVGIRCDGAFHNTITTFGGGPVNDSLSKVFPRTITDTGLAFSDGGIAFPVGPDTGLAFSESLLKSAHKFRVTGPDTAMSITDSLGKITLSDTGLTFSDSLLAVRIRTPTATGLTISDTLGPKTVRKGISDTGLTLLTTFVVQKNGHDAFLNPTDRGLSFASTLQKAASLFRVIPTPLAIPDQGVTIRDGIRRIVTPPQPPLSKPQANFTYSDIGLTVNFTNTSTPGSSGPITSSAWTFGDGGTSVSHSPSHTYASYGTYTVHLTVTGTGSDGMSHVAHLVHVVSPSAAGIHIRALVI